MPYRRQVLPVSGQQRSSSVTTKVVTDSEAGAVEPQWELDRNPGYVVHAVASDLFVFRPTCVDPAPATVCAGSA